MTRKERDLWHAVHFFEAVIDGHVGVDIRKMKVKSADRGVGRVNAALVRAMRAAPRGLVTARVGA